MRTMRVRTVYLEMFSRPERRVPPPFEGVEVVHTKAPTIASYRSLYDAVGTKWNWIERKRMSDEELAAIIHADWVEIHVLRVQHEPAGFCELHRHAEGDVQIMYFGLKEEFIGQGLGKYFLHWTVHKAWDYEPSRVWLHTCELDHPSALPVYLQAGFEIYDEKVIEQVVP